MNAFLATLGDNWHDFLRAFTTTVELFLLAAAGATVLGTLLGAMRVSPVPALRAFGTTYVQLVRNTPLTLVFALLVFAVPKLDVNIDYFPSAVIALTAYPSAFVCEVVRSGVNTVPSGQAEAARALGLTFGQVLTSIVLPQAFRAIVPPLVNVYNALLKNTTVAAGFSVVEAGGFYRVVNERGGSTLVALLWVALGFIILVIPLTLLQRRLEKRWSVSR
jgi:glutamate transport system permease protein